MLTNYLRNEDNIFCVPVFQLPDLEHKTHLHKPYSHYEFLLISQFFPFYGGQTIHPKRFRGVVQLLQKILSKLNPSSLVEIKGLGLALDERQFYLTYPREALAPSKYLFRCVPKFGYTVTGVD
jgi:hypothetical protein